MITSDKMSFMIDSYLAAAAGKVPVHPICL